MDRGVCDTDATAVEAEAQTKQLCLSYYNPGKQACTRELPGFPEQPELVGRSLEITRGMDNVVAR